MDYFLGIIRKYKFFYILIISFIATVLVMNNAIEFAERVINNKFLLIFSLLVFYSLVQLAIRKELKRK